jgi:hypothetical protein
MMIHKLTKKYTQLAGDCVYFKAGKQTLFKDKKVDKKEFHKSGEKNRNFNLLI